MKALLVLILLLTHASAQNKLGGAIIESLHLDESNTIGEGIELVRKAALKGDKFFALDVQRPPAQLQEKFRGRMTLKKVPALVALQYICDDSRFTFAYHDGLWKISNTEREYPDDRLVYFTPEITEAESNALGIKKDPDHGVTTNNGEKWPAGEDESAALLESGLLVRGRRDTIEQLQALLTLHRAGYQIPKAGSNKPAK